MRGCLKQQFRWYRGQLRIIRVRPESFDFWGGLFQLEKHPVIKRSKSYGFQKQVQRSDNGQDF